MSAVLLHRSPLLLGLSAFLLWVPLGCAATSPSIAHAPPSANPAKPTPTIEVPAVVVSPYSDAELAEQFGRAREKLLAERYKEAAEDFDRLLRLAPDGEVAPPSLYNGALAREALGERKEALARYTKLLDRFPEHATVKGALVRSSRLYAYLERWGELVDVADRLLVRKDLSVLERIEAQGAKALGLVEQDKIDEASKVVNTARDLIEEHRLGEAGKPPIELAQVSFALGEVRRKRSEEISFTPLPLNFAEVLEQRCQGLLDAQSAYTEAMRAYDAHWSAMAGYRVGQLYQRLHRDVMQINPTPQSDTLKKKQLFEGAMRLRYRVLLEKGLAMMEGTVRLGERTGEDSVWVHRAQEAKRDIELALEEEKSALAKLPFSEEELREALEKLKSKKSP